MATPAAHVTPSERLGFTAFLAVAVHAILILGISISAPSPGPRAATLDVTLTQLAHQEAPDDADFIAQHNQQGSGEADERLELTTRHQAAFANPDDLPVQLESPSAQQQHALQFEVLTTTQDSDEQVHTDDNETADQPDAPINDRLNPLDIHREIASLQARLDAQQQAYAQRPRVRRITSVSAKAHYEAQYLDVFRRRVEDIGTRHFPARALHNNTYGAVRMLVSLDRQGDIRDIQVLRSSGFAYLDQAAMQSVRLAAPFPPFTSQMSENMDVLEIIRTWRFDIDRRLTSG